MWNFRINKIFFWICLCYSMLPKQNFSLFSSFHLSLYLSGRLTPHHWNSVINWNNWELRVSTLEGVNSPAKSSSQHCHHYHSQEEDCWLAGGRLPPITEIEVTITELLRSLPVTISLALFIINFVLSGAASPRDPSF